MYVGEWLTSCVIFSTINTIWGQEQGEHDGSKCLKRLCYKYPPAYPVLMDTWVELKIVSEWLKLPAYLYVVHS